MASEDSEWVVESIAGYLGSPEWVIPVTDFMENKCTVFDDEDENKLTYTEIHQQYKHLVEKLLETYMQEVGINEQQFLEACSSPFAKSKVVQTVFQPILATDDFQMFRALMVQKNIELQLQALRVIKQRNGALPECLIDGADVKSELEQQEMKILQEVLKTSKEEYELEMARRLQSEEEMGSTSRSCCDGPVLEAASIQSPASAQQTNSTSNVTSTSLKREESAGAQGVGQVAAAKTSTPAPSTILAESPSAQPMALPAVRVPVKGTEPGAVSKEKSSRAGEGWIEEARKEAGFCKPFTELSSEQQKQLQQRALYLRQQRDKLQAMKKEQKSKPATPEDPPPPAPSTPEISVEERKKLQKRKHLAEKLKEEVIKK
ncbi:hypothetical protein DPEC_G00034440 [Dallia pectoralis]|uniref:Uncharacterized protein n=1 Tax=Dallia pectoralis TaxID=75939 RepID=A0ACC2HDX6_DALPE|nr:hypothetical protein DPEC_G00034440 [Dallia pectoralis]